MVDVQTITSSDLSTFKTTHKFLRFGEFDSVESYLAYRNLARDNGWPLYILGNGSNTLFAADRVKSLVIRNRMPRSIQPLGDDRYEIAAATPIIMVLKMCLNEDRDCFYYLSSVPAMIGGALAMNAGRGRDFNMTIYDFVESITYLDENDQQITLIADQVERDYRWTVFTGCQEKLILKAIFKFPVLGPSAQSPIRERVEYSKEVQDHSAGNCGSVFKQANFRILRWLRGFRLGPARYSPKTLNWILNRGQSSRWIRALIFIALLLHRIFRKRIALELIKVK